MLDGLGKLFFRVKWQLGQLVATPSWVYAYEEGKRREQVVASQLALGWRLEKAGLGYSTPKASLHQAVDDTIRPMDQKFFHDRINEYELYITSGEEDITM